MAQDGSVRPYEKPAGGWGALRASGKSMMESRAPVKSLKTLLRVNQPNGFDCPGCAWPEPESGHTSGFEFCENGVKAVTWEMTAVGGSRLRFVWVGPKINAGSTLVGRPISGRVVSFVGVDRQ